MSDDLRSEVASLLSADSRKNDVAVFCQPIKFSGTPQNVPHVDVARQVDLTRRRLAESWLLTELVECFPTAQRGRKASRLPMGEGVREHQRIEDLDTLKLNMEYARSTQEI